MFPTSSFMLELSKVKTVHACISCLTRAETVFVGQFPVSSHKLTNIGDQQLVLLRVKCREID